MRETILDVDEGELSASAIQFKHPREGSGEGHIRGGGHALHQVS
jgi:hypothetical protein